MSSHRDGQRYVRPRGPPFRRRQKRRRSKYQPFGFNPAIQINQRDTEATALLPPQLGRRISQDNLAYMISCTAAGGRQGSIRCGWRIGTSRRAPQRGVADRTILPTRSAVAQIGATILDRNSGL